MAKISWSRKALKQLMTLPSQNRLTIAHKVELLGTFPTVRLDIKKLHGTDNQYRLVYAQGTTALFLRSSMMNLSCA